MRKKYIDELIHILKKRKQMYRHIKKNSKEKKIK